MIFLLIKSKILIISEPVSIIIYKIQSLNKLNDKHPLSLFHVNSCSFRKNIEDLELLLDSTQIRCDVKAQTETRILKNTFPVTDIKLPNIAVIIAQLSHLQKVQCYT